MLPVENIEKEVKRIENFVNSFELDFSSIGVLLNPSSDSVLYHIRCRGCSIEGNPSLDWKIDLNGISYRDLVKIMKEELDDEIQLQYVKPDEFEATA